VGARPNLITTATDFAIFMQMLANGGSYKGRKFLGAGTVAMLTENQLGEEQLRDYENDYLAGYGYGLGFRTLMTRRFGHNGHLGAFGWTGGSGSWVEADPVGKFSIAYMHNMMPTDELYHHHRLRTVAYGCML
jgi:CubicO group peptidase (beta-lactamase class C family)